MRIPFFEAQLIQSRMRLLSVAVKKHLENDVLLPNSYRDNATVLELRNGVPMLFYPKDLAVAPADAADEKYVIRLISIAKRIQTENLRVIFVLVPNKYAVYAPLLARNSERATEKLGMRLKWLESALRASGVEAVNVTADLQRAAAVRLERGKYVWFLDDTHWNAAGIRVTAEKVTRFLGTPR